MSGSLAKPITRQQTQPVVGRLAPSPTGALHLGNARSFLLAWLSIRQQHGRLILRIEDIDSPRVKPWGMQSTIDDLRWLGLDWDAGPEDAMDNTVSVRDSTPPIHGIDYIQTRRLARYRQVLEQLVADGSVYRCTCSRSEVALAASAPHESSLATLEGPIYPGTCRPSKTSDASRKLSTDKFAWRWRFADGELTWTDQLRGIMHATPAEQLGDFVIARGKWPDAPPSELHLSDSHLSKQRTDFASALGDCTPAYQLAVVVDDHDMQVTEVVRGDDLIFSTFRQLAILEHLGWPPPRYIHVPLMIGPDGRRLAKRHGDTRLSTFRQSGVSPERVVGYLAWTLGLQAAPEPLQAVDLIGRFDWQALPLAPTIVDNDLLPW
ncbi:MAG: tRNA glutamyl-Q(34) synthetase GluQRS [Planctomycetales bacterium]|nr:tRNA glutamyl-Q(34) synthetase GluQRS [Planctomycetales bacterium]